MQKYGISMGDDELNKLMKEAGVHGLYGSGASATTGLVALLFAAVAAVFVL